MSNKIIFLDIDGCLVTGRSIAEYKSPYKFDTVCVGHLNWITKTTGAKIVISSSWRIGNRLTQMQEILKKNNVEGEVVDMTPVLHYGNRGVEITEWLMNNRVNKLVIIDDNDDMGTLFPYLVKTDFNQGITKEDADEAVSILCL